MPRHVPDEELTPGHVPAPDAAWAEVSAFGHTFHAYKVAGSLQRVSDLTLATHDRWLADGDLPDDLTRLRLALFHTVRATGDVAPDEDTEHWARALVTAIGREVARRRSH
ncbi:MAG: hypothetical protein KY461_07020 [Actinobacteria bacterium]|nr:hypothetical protein [Actinomycetota bacterium]